MIRVAYVFTSAGKIAGSVQTKVMNQIEALNENGVDCKGIFFTTEEITGSVNSSIEYVKVNKISSGWFRSIRQKNNYHQAILQYFQQHNEPFDFIYCRYPGASKYLLKWVKNNQKKVFFEHVTSELYEIKLNKKDHPLKLKLSSLLSCLEFYYLPVFQETVFGKKIRQNALFGICNSTNIAQYENKVCNGNYIQIINGDAVNARSFKLKSRFPSDETFKFIFLKGASTNADFNGLDRIFNGLANYNGNTKIKFYLYGKNLQNEKVLVKKLNLSENVVTGDFVGKSEIDELVEEMNIGIGALAVHRKGLTETTTIKTREYMARGLPFIYGHKDPDLSDRSELRDICLELNASDQALDFEMIIKWYKHIELSTVSERMRKFAQENLDYKIKMNKVSNKLRELKNKI